MGVAPLCSDQTLHASTHEFATDICRTLTPELREVGSGHQARCHWWEKIAELRGTTT